MWALGNYYNFHGYDSSNTFFFVFFVFFSISTIDYSSMDFRSVIPYFFHIA